MKLRKFFFALSSEDRESLAKAAGTTRGHLQNIAYGYRDASAELAVAIERVTKGEVTRRDLRPGDWQDIWPELALPSPQLKEATNG